MQFTGEAPVSDSSRWMLQGKWMAMESSLRPGGRTERNTEAILRAVLELIASSGMQFTYEDVAQLAGVSRRTLHRRWSDRTALIADALASNYRRFKVPATGNLAKDVRNLAYRFRDFCDDPVEIAINGFSAISPDTEFAHMSRIAWEKSHGSHAEIFKVLRRDGFIRAGMDTGTILNMLMSPILLSSTILRVRMTDKELDSLVDHTLMMLAIDPHLIDDETCKDGKRPDKRARHLPK